MTGLAILALVPLAWVVAFLLIHPKQDRTMRKRAGRTRTRE